MAAIEERFQAAVNVIKGLPKNGPYQPSTAMMLKFYGYYKQATEGPCHQKRPGFWDVVGKAKWDAWNDNRHLSNQQAMERYVDSLREIIETMSFTENVQNFVGSVSGLDNINLDELDMVVPGMRELAESHPNSPFNSRTNSPQHGVSVHGSSGEEDDLLPSGQINGHLKTKNHLENSSNMLNGTSENDALTTNSTIQLKTPIALMPETTMNIAPTQSTYAISNGTVDQSDDEYGDPADMNMDFNEAIQRNTELLKQIQTTVMRMNTDMITVNQRISNMEKVINDVRASVAVQKSGKGLAGSGRVRAYPIWWPFDGISPMWFALLILWPFVIRRLSRAVTVPRRN